MTCLIANLPSVDVWVRKEYLIENGHVLDGLGNDENYFWKTAKEHKIEENNSLDS